MFLLSDESHNIGQLSEILVNLFYSTHVQHIWTFKKSFRIFKQYEIKICMHFQYIFTFYYLNLNYKIVSEIRLKKLKSKWGGVKHRYLGKFFKQIFFLKSHLYNADKCFSCFQLIYIYCIMLRMQFVRFLDHRRMPIHKLTNCTFPTIFITVCNFQWEKFTNYYHDNMVMLLQYDIAIMIPAPW
jgi:hypothetical protein